MKQTRVLAILAVAFLLGAAASFISLADDPDTSATSITPTTYSAPLDAAGSNSVSVGTEAELNDAIASDATTHIILTEDITITTAANPNGLVMRRDSSLAPLTLDLNGHNITSEGNYILHNVGGHIIITGTGTLSAQYIPLVIRGSADLAEEHFASLEVGAGVTINNSRAYGVAIMSTNNTIHDCYGVQVTINGKINAAYPLYINGSIKHLQNPVKITIGDTAELTSAIDAAIYAAGYAVWQIGAAKITGEPALGIKTGSFTFNGTTAISHSTTGNPSTGSGGIDPTGAVFQIEHHKSYADNVVININGGTYINTNGDVFYEYGLKNSSTSAPNLAQADINISNGTFTAGDSSKIFGGDTDDMNIEIRGGTFSGSDLGNFAENGYLVGDRLLDTNGTVVSPSAPRPSQIATPDLILSDNDIAVEGILPSDTRLSVETIDREVAAFQGHQTALYDINLLDAADQKINPNGTVTVRIPLPAGFDGEKSSVYHVDNSGKIERLASDFIDGKLVFTTTHFSIYAVVEDGGASAPALISQADPSLTPSTGLNKLSDSANAALSIVSVLCTSIGIALLIAVHYIRNRARDYEKPAEAILEANLADTPDCSSDAPESVLDASNDESDCSTTYSERFTATPVASAATPDAVAHEIRRVDVMMMRF